MDTMSEAEQACDCSASNSVLIKQMTNITSEQEKTMANKGNN